ncbi:MAG: helix-turn-helix transcriptional regulator, partial [Erysipelotrichaceae bacterium]|nr:helix-turn-helix transcriptional regulator [Erysipelotrichaceae bacterium]
VTLDDVARHFSYTPEYTSRLIKKVTNSTFMNLVTDSRMKHAVSLLKSTRLSIAQISSQVGYENTENFIRTFRKKYNMTPSAYRKISDSNYMI